MPKWGNQDYKSAVFDQLAKGSGGGDRDEDHFPSGEVKSGETI